MIKLNNKGVALIAAVATVVIFLMLVLAITITSVATAKKSRDHHDRLMALYLAEAGINDAFYRMNYQHYGDDDGFYPNPNPNNDNEAYLDPDTTLANAWTSNTALNNPFNLPQGNGYQVQFLLIPGSPDIHRLRSTGIYNGKRRVITVDIRGSNTSGHPLEDSNQGISEAFNKHVIYAHQVDYSSAKVYGNIVFVNGYPGSWPPLNPTTNPYTTTKVEEVSLPQITYEQSSMPTPPIVYTYDDGSESSPPGGPTADYDKEKDTYTFSTGNISLPTLVNGNVILTGTAQVDTFLEAEKDITVNSTSVRINAPLKAGNRLIIENIDSNSNLGWLEAGREIHLHGGRFTGPIISGGSITLDGPGTYDINLSSQTSEAAICGGGTITINAPLTNFILGPSQKVAILAYSTADDVTIEIKGDLKPTYNDASAEGAQAAIVAKGNSATITIGSGPSSNVNIDDAAVPGRSRLIYAHSSNSNGGITLDNGTGTVYGTLVTNGTVTLSSGTLRYDASLFLKPPNSAFNLDIYRGFSGGRRVYLPVPGSWREE